MPLSQYPSFATFASLVVQIENNLGNAFNSATPPNQLSFQKETSFPSSTFHLNPSSKLLPQPSEAHTSFRSFHQRELLLLFPSSPRLLHPPYLETRTSFQRPPLSEPNLQIHFPSKAKLNNFRSIIPKPPNSWGLQTKFQEAHENFFRFWPTFLPPQTTISIMTWRIT